MKKRTLVQGWQSMLSAGLMVALAACGGGEAEKTLEIGTKFTVKPSQVGEFVIAAAQKTATEIEVSWELPSGVNPDTTDVIIEYKPEGTANFEEAAGATPKLKDEKKLVEGLEPETLYTFRAYLRQGTDLSEMSDEVTATTLSLTAVIWAKPENLTITDRSSPYDNLLEWSYDNTNFEEVSSVEILRSAFVNPEELIATRTTPSEIELTQYSDTTPIWGAVYTYTVRVTYSNGETFSVSSAPGFKTNPNTVPVSTPANRNLIEFPILDPGTMEMYLSQVNLSWTMAGAGQNGHNGFILKWCKGMSGSTSCTGNNLLESLSIASTSATAGIFYTSRCLPGNPNYIPDFFHFRIQATSTQGNAAAEVLIGPNSLQCMQ